MSHVRYIKHDIVIFLISTETVPAKNQTMTNYIMGTYGSTLNIEEICTMVIVIVIVNM